ncbi:MAG: hypothetical protein ACI910_002435, partial [Oleispira sp.]
MASVALLNSAQENGSKLDLLNREHLNREQLKDAFN